MFFLGMLITFLIGFLISFINYKMSRFMLINKAKMFSAFSFVRQVLNIGYLLLCYFLAPYTPFDAMYMLIGAVLGITVPMFYFTSKLVKISDVADKTTDKEEL